MGQPAAALRVRRAAGRHCRDQRHVGAADAEPVSCLGQIHDHRHGQARRGRGMINEKTITDFIYREAELLDTMQWQAWLDLFHPDGRYWMPLEWQQQDPVLQPSLMYDDLLLLKVRAERLSGERTFSQKPKSRCHHLLQAPQIIACDAAAGVFKARTSYIYTETRGDMLERYSGWASHDFVQVGDVLKIRLKRVDLVNFDAPFGNIQLFM